MKFYVINKNAAVLPNELPIKSDVYTVYGMEADTKPAGPPDNCMFIEIDTGRQFRSLGGNWECIVTKVTVSITEPPVFGRQINDQWIQILE